MATRPRPLSVFVLRTLGFLALASIPISMVLGRTRSTGCPSPITGPCDPIRSTPSWTGYAMLLGVVVGVLLLLAASHVAEVWNEDGSMPAVRRTLVRMSLWTGAILIVSLPLWAWLARERSIGCGPHTKAPCDPAMTMSASAVIGFVLALLIGAALLTSAAFMWIRGRLKARSATVPAT